MQKREIIGIVVVVILLIVLAFVVLGNKKINSNPVADCNTSCHQIGSRWTFPGVSLSATNSITTKEECVSACQAKTGK